MTQFNISREEILEYHLGGKVGLALLKRLENQRDLSLAYTPGVSQACLAIRDNEKLSYELTSKGNLVAVVTDGTAVLGLGNIGARASIPVMEGKAVLFKAFAGVDGWPVPLENVCGDDGRTDVEKFVEAVSSLACMYGGINLEDIAAPACFEIEDRLDSLLDIPVFHDDQWGTAIITLAALENYCVLSGKDIKKIRVVINGAGAAGLRIAEMIKAAGVSDCCVCDSKGLIHTERNDANKYKKAHAVPFDGRAGLAEVLSGADVFIGVSVADCLTEEMASTMSDFPAVFAMANPDPEIRPEAAAKAFEGREYVMATGRSDFPNQINNVLGFPFIFRGALDVRATSITMGMKVAAARALAALARESSVPAAVKNAYGKDFSFGPDYLIPTPFDPRIRSRESRAVAEAAVAEGVAGIKKIPAYR
ncbi:MAG: malate dehydrogenase [Candidatus Omnitrophica bacterium]|nr:malate dehydrogenase [Candidatus Omnitrophota bacterium]